MKKLLAKYPRAILLASLLLIFTGMLNPTSLSAQGMAFEGAPIEGNYCAPPCDAPCADPCPPCCVTKKQALFLSGAAAAIGVGAAFLVGGHRGHRGERGPAGPAGPAGTDGDTGSGGEPSGVDFPTGPAAFNFELSVMTTDDSENPVPLTGELIGVVVRPDQTMYFTDPIPLTTTVNSASIQIPAPSQIGTYTVALYVNNISRSTLSEFGSITVTNSINPSETCVFTVGGASGEAGQEFSFSYVYSPAVLLNPVP